MRDRQHELLLLLASLFLQNEKPEQAVVLLEALQVLAPGDPEVARQLAFAYLHTQQFAQSLAAADRYLAGRNTEADSGPLMLIRSRALWGLGRADEARSVLSAIQADKRKQP